MPDELTVETRSLERGRVLELPRRPSPSSRAWALVPATFGLLFTALPVLFVTTALTQDDSSTAMRVFLCIFMLPFLAIGLGGLIVALAIVSNRVTLRVGRDTLAVIERVGPLRWTKTHALRGLGDLAVAVAPRLPRNARQRAVEDAKPRHGLRATRTDDTEVWLVKGYPPEFLGEVARELNLARGVRDEVMVEEAQVPAERVAVAVAEALDDLNAPSNLEAHVEGAEWILEVPAAGLVKGSRGLFSFALFWNGFMVIFTAAFLGIGLSSGDMGGKDLLVFAAFASIFWAVGIGFGVSAWNMGKRTATLRASRSGLEVERNGPFGAKSISFERDSLKSIRVGHSGLSVNDVPVNELQIEPTRGKQLGMLSQRPDDELEWIARSLRARLELDR